MASMISQELERRLQTIQNTRLWDDASILQLESLLSDCSSQWQRVLSSTDRNFIALVSPTLLRIVVTLLKQFLEKSDPIPSRDKCQSLLTINRQLYYQIKEFFKASKLVQMFNLSNESKMFCEQVLNVCDCIGQCDTVMTLLCQKLIVKLITGGGGDDQSQVPVSSSVSVFKVDEAFDDGFPLAVYNSIIKQMTLISERKGNVKIDPTRESQTWKMSALIFHMLQRLLQYPGMFSQIDTFQDFLRALINLHAPLDSTYQDPRIQLEFFNSTILLQNILLQLIQSSKKLFFDDLFHVYSSIHHYPYASCVLLLRLIEALDLHLTNRPKDRSILLMDRLLSEFFDRVDQCPAAFLVALLPFTFTQSKVKFGSLYDISYSFLLKLVHRQPMQILLSSMTHLISTENLSILAVSSQLACELIIQSSYLYGSHPQCQQLLILFMAELLRLDRYPTFVQHLLTLPMIQPLKSSIYQSSLSSDRLNQCYHLFNASFNVTPSFTISTIYPTELDHLYRFVCLFHSDLTPSQQQHAFDTCLYAMQQLLSLPQLTESNCEQLRTLLRLLTNLPDQQQVEQWKSFLGQLTQLFILLDDHSALDIRLELLRLFARHCSILEENDVGRLFDHLLTSPIDSTTTSSIAFHLGCLDLLDAFREKSVRSSTINDLIIQLIVRYGNENPSHPLIKAQLIVNLLLLGMIDGEGIVLFVSSRESFSLTFIIVRKHRSPCVSNLNVLYYVQISTKWRRTRNPCNRQHRPSIVFRLQCVNNVQFPHGIAQ